MERKGILSGKKHAAGRNAAIVTLSMILLLAAGCIDYREEIYFNTDLSGTITIDILIGEMFVDMAGQVGYDASIFTEEGIRSRLGTVKGISIINLETYTADTNRRIKIYLKFLSVDALRRIFTQISEIDFLADISLVDIGGGKAKFTRTVTLADSTIAAMAMYDEKLGQRFWVSKIHFPSYVLEANAPEQNIDDKTHQIVTWGYAVNLLREDSRTMEAVFTGGKSLDILPLAVAGIVFLAVLFGLYAILGKKTGGG